MVRMNSRDLYQPYTTAFREGETARVRIVQPSIWSCNVYQAIFCSLLLVLAGLLGVYVAMLLGWKGFPIATTPILGGGIENDQVTYSNGYTQIHIGPSLSGKKCVQAPSNIFCGKLVQEANSIAPPIQWTISHELGDICAHRATAPLGAWTQDLVLQCKTVRAEDSSYAYATNTGNVEHEFLGTGQTATDKPAFHKADDTAFQQTGGKVGDADSTYVTIGNTLDSKHSTKCVLEPAGVICDNTAQQVGRTGKYDDTFNIYREAGKVCAHRTDANAEWGLNLVLRCRKAGTGYIADDSYTMVQIGSSTALKSNTKCVEAPVDVHCDDHATQIGRTGKYSDRFHIYHDDKKICAKRTDHQDPWGLNLVIKCKNLAHVTKFQDVTIGRSLHSHVKCVPDPGNVHCDNTAKQVGRTGKYPDTFDIYHKGDQICAKRTDHGGQNPWGLNLILKCKSTAR